MLQIKPYSVWLDIDNYFVNALTMSYYPSDYSVVHIL